MLPRTNAPYFESPKLALGRTVTTDQPILDLHFQIGRYSDAVVNNKNQQLLYCPNTNCQLRWVEQAPRLLCPIMFSCAPQQQRMFNLRARSTRHRSSG